MPKGRREQFKQDRVGTTVRELDDYRASDGMSEDNGKAVIETEDVGDPVVAHVIPADARGVVLTEIHAHNSGAEENTFRVWSGTFEDPNVEDPVIDEVTERSVPFDVSDGVTRTIPYVGRAFEEDFIAVTSEFEGEIGLGLYNDHREYEEPASEQTGVAE